MDNNRDHDGFFKFVYSVPVNARALLELSARNNGNLSRMLADIDLGTLERLPSTYNNVGERGEADVAFKAKAAGKDVFVGLLLEHKSYDDNAVIDQIGRYMFNVMVDKNNTDFRWLPSKAVIIYNGRKDWDPLATFRNKERAKFQGNDLPFECVLVNLADIADEDISASENPEAALGALIMKYAFNAKAIEERLSLVESLFEKMPNNLRSLMLEKIKVYLGEYISKEYFMELEKEFVSIGQRLGFESAGDYRRKLEKQVANQAKEISTLANENSSLTNENAALRARIAEFMANKA
ncbi:Rpn family recombination-promoting nuclease/putative transposase [Fibrobacter sp. UWEL]|uniref:Rpn family recombination-promoting nuclease/putative transposase n=1 Tax=Fibrobacter sp. UWEL TaxID=1896209 RepID=UPI00091D212D|nr:Rpn family recombination-promoting nuclease/putative transposase [Fibrobacter sp. UWEL]SHK85120.1 Putative transposase, YhgA-like [Fibrobacter sp. UWEL]